MAQGTGGQAEDEDLRTGGGQAGLDTKAEQRKIASLRGADGGFIRHSLQLRFGIAAQVRIVMASPMPPTQSRNHAITSV